MIRLELDGSNFESGRCVVAILDIIEGNRGRLCFQNFEEMEKRRLACWCVEDCSMEIQDEILSGASGGLQIVSIVAITGLIVISPRFEAGVYDGDVNPDVAVFIAALVAVIILIFAVSTRCVVPITPFGNSFRTSPMGEGIGSFQLSIT